MGKIILDILANLCYTFFTMTKAEYNRDVKRLRNYIKANRNGEETYIASEFRRLYGADKTFEYANKDSVLTLLRINLRYRLVPLHMFGIYATALDI